MSSVCFHEAPHYMTKRVNLSYNWICDTSIIQQFFSLPKRIILNIVFVKMSHSHLKSFFLFFFFTRPTQFLVLWSAIQIWKICILKPILYGHLWYKLVEWRGGLLHHECYVWLLSKVFKVPLRNMTFMIHKGFFPRYHLHMLLALCTYIQM